MQPLFDNPPALVAQAADADRLATLAPKVNRGHGAILTHQDHALQGACDVGRWLIEARDLVLAAKLNWGDWIAENCEFSRDTAERYICIAANWALIDAELPNRPLSIHEACQFVRATQSAAKPRRTKKTPAPDASSPPEKSTENVPTSASLADVGTPAVSYSAASSQPEESADTEVATQTEPLAAREASRQTLPIRPARTAEPVRMEQPAPAGPSLQDRVIVELREANLRLQRELEDAKTENLKLTDALAREKREKAELMDKLAEAKGKPAPAEGADTLDALRGMTPPPGSLKVERGAAEEVARHYQDVVKPGETIGGAVQIIRGHLQRYSKEQLLNSINGFALFCRRNGKEKKPAVSTFFSEFRGSFREFLDYQPGQEQAEQPLQTAVPAAPRGEKRLPPPRMPVPGGG